MSSLNRLQKWYISQCNGDWEHEFGIKINTIDNPGWSVQLSIAYTPMEHKIFDKIFTERSENDWIHAVVEDKLFKLHCGPSNLEEALEIFLNWADDVS